MTSDNYDTHRLSSMGRSRLSTETRNRVGHVHSETEPFLLQLIKLAALLHRGDTPVDEVSQLLVFLAERVAMPVVTAHVGNHRECRRLVAHHHREGGNRVEHSIDAPLRQSEIRGGMIIIGLDVLEAGTAFRLELLIELERSEERRVGKECRCRWERCE